MLIFLSALRRLTGGITLALVMLIATSTPPALAGIVRSVTASSSGSNVMLKIQVTQGLDGLSSFALAAPDRIVIDLAGATTAVASAAGAGAAAKVRIGQFNVTTTRLVIDLSAPLTLLDASANSDRTEIAITMRPADSAGFARYAKAPRRRHALGGTTPGPQLPTTSAQAQPLPLPAGEIRSTPAPPAAEAVVTKPIVDTSPLRPENVPKPFVAARGIRPLVVIDAGHGGHDTGALSVWDEKREKDVTLAIAKAIKRELDESGRVRSVLTRSDDRFLVLSERREVARRLKADLFISIHADSAGNPDASGATVYTLSDVASDRQAARLAARENKSDIINGIDLNKEASDVSSILIDLARRDTMNVSSSFAALLQREMSPSVKFKSEFHRFAGFIVLKAPDTPSVLLETGYLSNMEDSRFLFSTNGQKAIAKGVKAAVEAHFARRYRTR